MRAIYVPITDEDLAELRDSATKERRRPQDQAAVLLAEALRRRRPGGKTLVAAGRDR